MSLAPGAGEIVLLPFRSRHDETVTNILFEAIPGGRSKRSREDPTPTTRTRSTRSHSISSRATRRRCMRAHVGAILEAARHDAAVADAFADNFGHPEEMWRSIATPERAAAFLARTGSAQAAPATALAA